MSVASASARPGTEPTARELEVLRAWRDSGGDTAAVARDLGITPDGARAILANVRARAGVRRTWQAVLRYLT